MSGPVMADYIVAQAAVEFRRELEVVLRDKLRPEMEMLLEHTVREVADTVFTDMSLAYNARNMAYDFTQRVIIKKV